MSIHKTASGRWEVRWRESGRGSRNRSRTFRTLTEARRHEAKVVETRGMGAHAPAEASRERLEDFLARWFASNQPIWAPSTSILRASVIDRWIVPYLGDVRLRDLGTARCKAWRDAMSADGASPVTVTNVMKTLSAALGDAAEEGDLPANPLRGLKRPQIIREPRQSLSAEQAERVRAELPSQRDRVLWGFMYAAGLRTEEALALRWSDVLGLSRAGGMIKVDRVFNSGQIRNTTKTKRGRDVPVIAPLAQDLVELYESTMPEDNDELICPSRVGTPMNLHNWRARTFNPAAERVGVGWATPYTGRTTYISLQIHAGLSPVTVAALAGNSPDIIWKHYAREFERSKTTRQIDLEGAIRAARRSVSSPGVRNVFGNSNVIEFRRRA